ncbi:uncharacterized protein PITG_01722 [Phytophthora infestans T30-4]|uniref:Uncharacterized protein n=1 Tax=Phytophthora infestans (strain T30-4) TaxID=403677 RepID=D0MTX8_PHYIT|nr:uncharacterized protein PITG_01722 [Phytophthora infestans T30-4]EEY61425.1 conserved hypothetical protein [Phytophthora infestans T30-4]|eukprot:XP_002908342.1 conserved hypothetical protein [Phytophthora infestans T30-4]
MELLIQQCATAQGGSLTMPSTVSGAREHAAANATILDLLAQTCVEANAAVQELSVGEVAAGLASAVSATQESLRSVGQNVGAILQDPAQMRELCYHVKEADAKAGSTVLMVSTDEENVRNMMVFAENMCTTMDHALSTITPDELALAAQLSLNIAQKLLDAGQSLFTSLGDEERRKLKRSAVLRTYVMDLYNRTREEAVEHPFLAGALTVAGLPFIGLAIPVASMVALALMIEKYYPEHAKLTMELCSNFIQMSKLWFLLLKISARQISVVAKECFKSWYEYASTNGFVATGFELASTGCSVGFLGVSYLYQMAFGFTKQAVQ